MLELHLFFTQLLKNVKKSVILIALTTEEGGTILKTDAHIHLLPGMDTGPCVSQEAAAMFQTAYDEGVRAFVVTPHYFYDRETVPQFLLRRRTAFRRLAGEVGARIHRVLFLSSAEVMLMPGVSTIPELPSLAIPGTDLLPVDFPISDHITDEIMRELAYIVQKRRLRPLFCHIERHFPFFSPHHFEAQLLGFSHAAFCVSAQAFPDQELSAAIIRALNNKKVFFLCSNGHDSKRRTASLRPQVALSGYSSFVYRRLAADTEDFFFRLRKSLHPHLTFT